MPHQQRNFSLQGLRSTQRNLHARNLSSKTGSVLGVELNRGDKCTYREEEIEACLLCAVLFTLKRWIWLTETIRLIFQSKLWKINSLCHSFLARYWLLHHFQQGKIIHLYLPLSQGPKLRPILICRMYGLLQLALHRLELLKSWRKVIRSLVVAVRIYSISHIPSYPLPTFSHLFPYSPLMPPCI